MDIDNPKLVALIAAEKTKHTNFELFMQAVHVHIVSSGIEDLAGTSKLGTRKVAELTADADADVNQGDKKVVINGVDYSKHLTSSGKISLPGSMWKDATQDVRDAILEYNQKLGGSRRRPGKRQRYNSRTIKQLKAEIAQLKGEGEGADAADGDDAKGSQTGSLIAASRK